MADHKSAKYPHQWPDGSWHSVPASKAPAASGYKAPAPAAAPAAPAAGNPFFTADDLNAINAFNTDLATKLQSIDTNLQNLQTDTTYQETQNDNAAKQNTASAQDDAIARGIFQSSIKDATLYDIEAQRSLSQKFLEDKLTTARLDAGTQKQALATSKTNFDTAMAHKQVENAQGVNDANNSAWATALAAWQAANPKAASAAKNPGTAPPGPIKPTTRPATPAQKPRTITVGPGQPGTRVKTNKKNHTQTYYGGVRTA